MRARFSVVAAVAAISFSAHAQTWERRAAIRGGGGPGGRCTIEVVVDGAAEVEVAWDHGILRNLSGRPPEWRRFECTSPMPPNPPNFRFRGIDGRGRQELVRDPRNSNSAVVRIEDRDNGAEGYTFELSWGGGFQGGPPPSQEPPRDYDRDRGRDGDRDRDEYHRDRGDWYGRGEWRERFFQHIREDVEHVRSVTFPFGSDQYRLTRTLQQLDELQDKLARHYYDERELNDVIDALGRVLRDNRLSPRDRNILEEDLNRMRDFRARRGEWERR